MRADAGRALTPARAASAERLALFLFALLLLAGIGWGLHPQSSWDVDNTAPGSVLKAIGQKFGPRWSSSYGPIPYFTMAVPMVPLLVAFKLTHELGAPSGTYPWGFAHPDFSVNALTVGSRAMTALAALLIAWMALREARRAGARNAWSAALLLAGSATLVFYGRTSNVDVHYLFWLWAAFHLAERAERARELALAGVCAAFAVCTKEQAAPFALVATLVACRRALASKRFAGGGVRLALLPPLAALVAYAVAWRLPIGLPGWREHLRFVFQDARYERTFAATLEGTLQLAARAAQQAPLALGWAVIAAFALALALRVSWRGLAGRAIACALYVTVFLGSIGYVYPRFLLPLLLLAVPLGARALGSLQGARARAALAVVALLALTGGPALTWTQARDSRGAAELWLAERPHARIELAGNPHFQARVPLESAIVVRPDSLAAAPRAPIGDVVLMSSVDAAYFERDSVVAAVWLAPLRDTTQWTAHTFEPPFTAALAHGLPVSPRVFAYERRIAR